MEELKYLIHLHLLNAKPQLSIAFKASPKFIKNRGRIKSIQIMQNEKWVRVMILLHKLRSYSVES